ncbi:MAG TPA: polyphenol oxidase family protein [Candidatus Acidoferrum sp.]|nr:polyphenol oxidase family protein [Candidatus Acidoferrum sp.]
MTFEQRTLSGGGSVLVSTPLESDGFLAAFSERSGGVSPSPYESLNLSLAVGDDDAAVGENRRRLTEGLGIDRFATAQQVHGAKLVRIGAKRAGAGFEGLEDRVPGADAMLATGAGIALAVLTADCVPVVAASAAAGILAVAHAGWRGIAAGVVGTVAAAFDSPKDVRVAIGPAVGPDHYEVGEDVALAVAAGTEAGAVTERRDGTTRLDLVGTIRAELRALGIRRVDDTGLCTACHPDRFFSYRRDEITGRQAAVAVRLGAA